MIKIKENQIITVSLIIGSEQLNEKGECGEYPYNTISTSDKYFNNVAELEKYLSYMGLELCDFKRFNSDDEPNRLNFCREEKENDLRFYVDYDLYINLYEKSNSNSYLNEFDEN